MHPIFKQNFRSLLNNKSTYFFIAFVAGIIILLLVLEGITSSQKGSVFSSDDKLLIVTNGISPRYPLPTRYIDNIRYEELAIDAVAGMTYVPTMYVQKRQSLPVIATNPKDFLETNTDLVVWDELVQMWIADTNSILAGRYFTDRYKLKLGDSITLSSKSFQVGDGPKELRLKIRAIYDIKDDAYPAYGIVIHEKLIRPNGQMTATQGLSSILVKLKGHEDAAKVASEIDELFKTNTVPTRTSLREQFVEEFRNLGGGLKNIIWFYGAFCVIISILLLCIFCYYNSSILKGVAINLSSIGFSKSEQIYQLALSQTIIALIGVFSGWLFAAVFKYLFSGIIEIYYPYFEYSGSMVIKLIVLAAILTFIAPVIFLTMIINKTNVLKSSNGYMHDC